MRRPNTSVLLEAEKTAAYTLFAVIDHTSFQVSDYEKSKAFYTRALAPLGYKLEAVFHGA